MKKIKQINKCLQYQINEKGILVYLLNNKLILNDKEIGIGRYSIRYFKKTILLVFDEATRTVIIYKNGKQEWTNKNYLIGIYFKLIDPDLYFVSINDGKNRYDATFNINSFKIIDKYESKLGIGRKRFFIQKNSFTTTNNHSIALFDFENQQIWKKDFSTLAYHHSAYLDSEIILLDNKIYFSINTESEGKPGIFCLDVHSGETLNFYAGNYYGLFKDGNNLYSTMYKNILVRINSETDQIQTFDTNPLLKENDFHTINDQRCAAKNGKFYFTQTFGAHNAKFGIIDFENQQLDYKYDFDKKNGAIGSIKFSDDRVFTHTQDNTLHIFEEENSRT